MAIQLSDEMIIMTPETVVQDEPNFISKGTFNTLFKDEHIIFDSNKGSL
jgi:iron complex transport system ATP-binding protein